MDQRYKKFVAVVDLGSFSAAAKNLRVSQPAITIAIASLERSLGKRLIERKRHAITLTPEGQIVYETSKRIASEIDQMQHALKQSGKDPVAHVGFIDSIAHLLYTSPPANKPITDIEAVVDNSMRIINDLLSRQIELGFITGQPAPLTQDITTYKLQDEQFVFVAAPNKARVGLMHEIPDWLAFNQDSTTYHHFMRQFKKSRLRVTPVFYSTSMELLKEMAIAGNGTALLPRHFVEAALQNNLLVIVETAPLYRPIWIITRKEDARPTLFEPLASRINELLAPKN